MSYLLDRNVTQGTIPWQVTNYFNAVSVDAFARQRVSTPFTLGDYKHLYGIDPNFIENTSNGGTVAFQANKACARLTTSSASNSSVIHQTKFYHHYMPGKSQIIMSSFTYYTATANVRKRVGYFDDNNGIFFEQAGDGTLAIVLRSYTSGVAVDRKFSQFGGVYGAGDTGWNVDACAGGASNSLNPSGFNLDVTKTQLLIIDFQWLGVGRIRVGFAHNGDFVLAHTFNGSNELDVVYMSTPNLPQRCEIVNTGTTTGAYFDQICGTVMSEGGYVEAGQDWAVSNPTLRTLTSGSTLPIMAIRLKNTFKTYLNRMIVRMGNVNIFSSGENIKWELIKLPNQAALTGSTWVDVGTDSGVQYNDTCTAYSGGDEIDNGWVGASTQGSQKAGGAPASNIPSSAKKNYIVQNYDSTDSEIYVIVATNLGTQSTDVGVGLQWREIY
jgi:hypothetical protein